MKKKILVPEGNWEYLLKLHWKKEINMRKASIKLKENQSTQFKSTQDNNNKKLKSDIVKKKIKLIKDLDRPNRSFWEFQLRSHENYNSIKNYIQWKKEENEAKTKRTEVT